MLIWQKHLFRKLFFTFLFFFVSLLIIYIMMDLSAHGVKFLSKSSLTKVMLFYLYTTSTLFDFFLSITFLLATMRTLYDLNTHRELLSLQMAGISKKELLTPFFLFACTLAIFGYSNFQWVFPKAQEYVSSFKSQHKEEGLKEKKNPLYIVSLEDESELVYQKKEGDLLIDVFWLCSFEDVWHINQLFISSDKLGLDVDHFQRNQDGTMVLKDHFDQKAFSHLPLEKQMLDFESILIENRSITSLFSEIIKDPSQQRAFVSHLYYKLLTPLLPFIILIIMGPILMRFSRSSPFFLTAAFAIFGFISLKIVLDGMLILGENQVLPAFFAICMPFMILSFFGGLKFRRMQ